MSGTIIFFVTPVLWEMAFFLSFSLMYCVSKQEFFQDLMFLPSNWSCLASPRLGIVVELFNIDSRIFKPDLPQEIGYFC